MTKKLINLLHEARLMSDITSPYIRELKSYGITNEFMNNFKSLISEGEQIDKRYTQEQTTLREFTDEQDNLVDEISGIISIIKNVARYRIKKEIVNNKLRVGIKTPQSVAKLIREAKLVLEGTKELKDDFIDMQFDMQVVSTFEQKINDLKTMDQAQESQKKELKELHTMRDEKIDELSDQIQFIKKVAAMVFKNRPEIKDKFFNLMITHGHKKETDTSSVNQ